MRTDARPVHVPAAEIAYHPLSYADPNGRLFEWRGELYRGVYPARADFYRQQVFATGTADALMQKALMVDVVPTALTADGFGLVLKCRRVPFVSYPFEWSAEMLRSAALLMLDLARELLARGLTLVDTQSWNILWDGTKPVYVDWGSIGPETGGPWQMVEGFRSFFLYPLLFMDAGHHRLARRLMHDIDHGIDAREAALLTPPAINAPALTRAPHAAIAAAKRTVPERWRAVIRQVRANRRAERSARVCAAESIEELRKQVAALALSPPASIWQGYYDDGFPSFREDVGWNEKHRVVARVLDELEPSTVLDVGSNRGWFAQLAAYRGARAIAFDVDEASVDRLYLDARHSGKWILPLVMSFTNPTPRYGVNNGFSTSATDRFQCDLVLALAITHHLVFACNLRFEQIAAGLAALTRRTLVVEFVPGTDQYVRHWHPDRRDWYDEATFIAALRSHFTRVMVRPSHPSPRVLLICER